MGIDLSCENALVSEHLLHNAEVSPVLYEMRSERMAESMRRNLLGDACKHCVMLHHIEYGDPAEPGSPAVEKKDIIRTARWLG